MLICSILSLVYAAQSFRMGLTMPAQLILNIKSQKADKYKTSHLYGKPNALTKSAGKFELSSAESVTTGLMIRHKSGSTKQPSRNGLAVAFYISKAI